MATWTTTDLLSTIQNRQMFPTASTGSLSDAVLLQFATEELYITLLPMIMRTRQKYYETYLNTSITQLTPSVRIPSRSIANVLSAVQYTLGTDIRLLYPIDASSIATTVSSAFPSNYYFQNNDIFLYPAPNTTQGTLTLRYFQRPSRLALTTDCAQITAYNSSTGVATFTTVPSTWTTSDLFDYIPYTASQATPFGLDSAISAISTTTMTFTSPRTDVSVGDWIALAGYTPIPEIPFEFQSILAQATAVVALGAINDPVALPMAKQVLKEMTDMGTMMISPRDETGLRKVMSGWRGF